MSAAGFFISPSFKYRATAFCHYMPATTQIIGDTETGSLQVTTEAGDGLQLKNILDEDGSERTIIEGFAATTHIDKGQDEFTVEALQSLAADINSNAETQVSTVFPEIEGMSESQIGNLNHNNNPAAEQLIGAGDTRIVPVFRIVHAEVTRLQDGEHALEIRGEMLPLPDDLEEAVKGQIRQGALHSFSIEFGITPNDVEFEETENRVIRRIHDAEAQGVALTGRPMNEEARLTEAELKNILDMSNDLKNETNANGENQTMTEETEDMKAEHDYEEKAADIAAGTDLDEDLVLQVLQAMHEEEEEAKNEGESEDQGGEEEDAGEPENDGSEGGDESDEGSEEVKTDQDEENEEKEEETVSEDVDLKSELSEIKNQVKTLKQEKEELEEQLSDMKTIEAVKNDIQGIKNELEDADVNLEGDRPIADQDQGRGVKNDADKPQWQRSIDQQGLTKEDLKSRAGTSGKTEAEVISELHGVKTEEVLDYAE